MHKRAVDFIRAVSPHKGALLGIAFLVGLFSFLPLQFVEANIFTDIFNIILTFPLRFFAIILTLIITVLALVFGFLFFLLGGTLKVFIIGTLAPVITGQGIHVVDIGWAFSRDLVNIILILILVFIGLATILRIQNYQMQRTLPLLIIVALLVNFSAVLVGFIVDISNLVTNALLSKMAGFNTDALKATLWDVPTGFLFGTLADLSTFGGGGILDQIGKIIGIVVYGVALISFYAIANLIFFILFIIFIARTIMLWTLTILAPLAFAAYVLPRTRGLWDMWLKQLIQWSIIGIPIALFLVLGMATFTAPVSSITPDFSDPNLSGSFLSATIGKLNGLFAAAMAPFVGLMLMMIGVLLSLQMAPAGVNKALKFGTVAGLAGAALGATWAWRRAGQRVADAGKTLKQRGETQKPGTGFLDRDIPALSQTIPSNKLTRRMGLAGKTFGSSGKRVGVGSASRFLTRWAGRGIEIGAQRGTSAIKIRDEKKFKQFKQEATSRDSFINKSLIAEEEAKPEWMRDDMKIAGLYAGMMPPPNEDADEVEDDFERGKLDKRDLGRVLVSADKNLGSFGRRPVARGIAPEMTYDPQAFGFNAKPKFDDLLAPNKITGYEPANPGGPSLLTKDDVAFVRDKVWRDYQNRAIPEELRTNATAPHKAFYPYDVERDANGNVQRDAAGDAIISTETENAKSSRAFIWTILDSDRPELFNQIMNRRERNQSRAVGAYIRSQDPVDFIKAKGGRFLNWTAGTAAANLGVGTAVSDNNLKAFVSTVERDPNITSTNIATNTEVIGNTTMAEIYQTLRAEGSQKENEIREEIIASHSP